MRTHLVIDSSDPEELQRIWRSRAQPFEFALLEAPLHVVISGLEVGGSSVFYTRARGGYRVRSLQLADAFSIAMISSGRVKFKWPARSAAFELLKVGAVAISAPGTEFEYETDGLTGISVKFGPVAGNLFRMRALTHRRRLELCGLIPAEDAADIFTLAHVLVREIDRKNFENDVPAQIEILHEALTQRISRYIQKVIGPDPDYNSADLATVHACDAMIRKHHACIHSVRDLVKHVSWSERQIYRAFDHVCDCTPGDYIRRTHLITARSMIQFPTDGIAQPQNVARLFGYKSLRAFTRDFEMEFDNEPPYCHLEPWRMDTSRLQRSFRPAENHYSPVNP